MPPIHRPLFAVLKGTALALALSLPTGCATGPDANPRDPIEPFNRGVHKFNDVVDEAVLKPVATAYQQITPRPVRAGVGNFFDNPGDLWSSVNAGLQLRPREATENLMRFSVNTVFGIAGLLVDTTADPVSGMDHVATRDAITALSVIDTSASLLRATSLLDDAALDKYSFTRDLYLNRRQSQIDDMIDRGTGLSVGPVGNKETNRND